MPCPLSRGPAEPFINHCRDCERAYESGSWQPGYQPPIIWRAAYLAHPVRPPPGSDETLDGNLAAAWRWYQFWCLRGPAIGLDVDAPWLAYLNIPGVDREAWEAAQRIQGMERNLRLARRFDHILLVGPRISTGMREEARAFHRSAILDITRFATPESLIASTDGTPATLRAAVFGPA